MVAIDDLVSKQLVSEERKRLFLPAGILRNTDYDKLVLNYSTDQKNDYKKEQVWKDGKIKFSQETTKDKRIIALPYIVTATYEVRNDGGRFELVYDLRNYVGERERILDDFTGTFAKRLHVLPVQALPGILGLTYPLEQNMVEREDMIWHPRGFEVKIHEHNHTLDEYETRRIVEWILSPRQDRYIR